MSNRRHIVLGTISFTVCLAAWGLIGAFAPRFCFRRSPSYPHQRVAAVDEIAVSGVKMSTYPTAGDPCILVRSNDSYVD
jgi:hypothetical protein